jgi:hypothetical protein
MSARQITWALSALAAGILGVACSTPAADSAPETVSCTRVIQQPPSVVRAAVPNAIAGLGPGRWTYAREGTRDTYEAVTESGMTVRITSEPNAEHDTVLNVVIVGAGEYANFFLFMIPESIDQDANRLAPQLSQLGYVGESKP